MAGRKLRTVLAVSACWMCVAATAGSVQSRRVAFVSCPLVRDTREVPCWLASDGRQLYYLGIQVDISANFHPPELKHQVLVEGVAADKPTICGGVVLDPVTISVLPELDRACDTVLGANGYTIENAPRGSGPSNRGRRVASDATPVSIPSAEAAPAPPAVPKTFSVPFAFDSLYMNVHAFPAVLAAARYATGFPGAHLQVVGYRSTVELTNGQLLIENRKIAQRRAEKVAEALEQLDVASMAVAIRWVQQATAADQSPGSRRVDITVIP